jgi:phage baseplate assembly protein W
LPNIIDSFKETSIGSSGRILDFSSKIDASGNFTILYDLDAIIKSWNNILITPKLSCDHDPDFGSNLYLFLFEPADKRTQVAIKNEIMTELSTYDVRATIDNITVNFFQNKKGFSVLIFVSYFGNKKTLNISFDEETYQSYM